VKLDNQIKEEQIATLKRHIKSTKLHEQEIEMKMYIDECTRLRHMLEEVVKNRDPMLDPENIASVQ
jgi:hypothetical protein